MEVTANDGILTSILSYEDFMLTIEIIRNNSGSQTLSKPRVYSHAGRLGQVVEYNPSCVWLYVLANAHLQNEAPAILRRRSASTIIVHRASSDVVGSQPNFSLAFAGLPMSRSTSAGR